MDYHTCKKMKKKFFANKFSIVILGLLLVVNSSLFYFHNLPGNLLSVAGSLPIKQIPDLHINIAPDEIYYFLTAIGPEDRAAFQKMHLSIDLSYPIIYGFFFFALNKFLVIKTNTKSYLLSYIPLFAMGFDLLENIGLVLLTNQFPDRLPALEIAVEFFTIIKFSTIILSLAIAIYLSSRAIIKKTGVN